MTRNIFIFLGTFALGAVVALLVRATRFQPHAGQPAHVAGATEYAAMVSNPLVPPRSAESSAGAASKPAATEPAAAHGAHGAVATAPVAGKPVNTVCAICGMAVDPNLPTAEYQGKTIGFGCKLCAPKFKAEPDRYGPAYLRDEVIKK